MKAILRNNINSNFYLLVTKVILLLAMINTNTTAKQQYTNSLINEDSPYLQQHAHNPVNWYAWGDEAFSKAKKENKMIFLSIGYSTCHWCHVMEKESFENEEVAKILNKYYISIKVDREEMPHIDKYYQDVHNLLNKRSGGWPLSIILTPDAKAFFAATYIPNEAKYGRSGIKELLLQLQGVFMKDTQKVINTSLEIERVLKDYRDSGHKEVVSLNDTLVNQFVQEIESSYDEMNPGIGTSPKFPHASSVHVLLDVYDIYKNKPALEMATKMLKAMANGGINDQIEGGFYRYSVDEAWMIPHFEKMLYTNAELLGAYARAYEITGEDFYKNIVKDINSFVKNRFENKGLLYSASDADSLVGSEKEEGAYFVFEYVDTKAFLEQKGFSENKIKEILAYFNITEYGNFEKNQTNPYLFDGKKPENLLHVKKVLKEYRSKKEYPFIDKKIQTSWNAMYVTALFEAGKSDKSYSKEALNILDKLLNKLYVNDELYHQILIGKEPKVKAYFEDYSFLITSLLSAYEYGLDNKYLNLARKLSKEAITKFYKNNNWYMSNDEFQTFETLYDNSYKSPLSNMIDNLLRLGTLDSDLDMMEIAKNSLNANSSTLSASPINSPWLLRSYMAYDKGYIALKAQKEMFKDKALPSYPFLVKKKTDDEKYLACSATVCFAYSDNIEDIKEKILDRLSK